MVTFRPDNAQSQSVSYAAINPAVIDPPLQLMTCDEELSALQDTFGDQQWK